MDIIDKWIQEILRLDAKWSEDWIEWDEYLDECQYSYIRLGLLLERIRNTNYWKLAAGKFSSFREWCEARMKLNIWQVNSYIESAQVAIYLRENDNGVPRNYSQAVALIPAYKAEEGYYGERPQLTRVWEEASKLKKITADAIKRIFDPSIVEKESTKLSKSFLEKARQAAAKQGLSLEDYLDHLVEADNDEGGLPNSTPVTLEQELAIDELERGWKSNANVADRIELARPVKVSIEPAKVIEQVGSAIDRMRQDMYDRYFPNATWRRSNE
jgi:hypothetical protein